MTIIARFQAENYKRLKAVEIVPGEGTHLVPILGRNAQGKSSVLDAITAALGGKAYMPRQPVRKGEDEGAIRIELSDGLVVRRIFDTEGGGSIVVENKDGARYPSPQAVLDKLYSSVAFDPIAFTRLKPAEQLETLRRLVKLEVDVDELARLNKVDYEARTEINREVRIREAQLPAEIEELTEQDNLIDEAPIEAKIASAAEHNGQIETRKLRREQASQEMAAQVQLAERKRQEAAALIEEAVQAEQRAANIKKQIDGSEPLPDPIDVSAAQEELRRARDHNARIQRAAAAATLKAEIDGKKRESAALTARMEQRDKDKAAAFEKAEMPVPGLTFGDGEVLFNGLPLDQASSAEQLRISVAVGMATNPELRVMLVRDASLLDDEGLALLAKMATDGDSQFWVESIDTAGKVGIIMEDGAVAGAPTPPPIEKGQRRKKKGDEAAKEAHAAAAEPKAEAEDLIDSASDEKGVEHSDARTADGAGEGDATNGAEPSSEPDQLDELLEEARAEKQAWVAPEVRKLDEVPDELQEAARPMEQQPAPADSLFD